MQHLAVLVLISISPQQIVSNCSVNPTGLIQKIHGGGGGGGWGGRGSGGLEKKPHLFLQSWRVSFALLFTLSPSSEEKCSDNDEEIGNLVEDE